MKSSPFSSLITKMNGGNYEMWAMQVKRTLIAHDKEHLILEPEPRTEDIANEVLHKESAKDMWDSLAATYSQARNETRIMQLHHDIHQMRQDGRPLHTYYYSLKSMFERLNNYFPACKGEQQKAYRDMLMVGVFLSGLDSVYESAKNQMLTSPSIPPIDEAYSRLSRIPIPAATVPDTTSTMLATRGRGGSLFAKGRGGRGRGNTTSRPVCQFCHRIGHTVDKCWQKHGRPAFANQTASTDSPKQPKAQHTASSSELHVDDIISQLRNLIGDRPQHAPDPTTSTITTAASAFSSAAPAAASSASAAAAPSVAPCCPFLPLCLSPLYPSTLCPSTPTVPLVLLLCPSPLCPLTPTVPLVASSRDACRLHAASRLFAAAPPNAAHRRLSAIASLPSPPARRRLQPVVASLLSSLCCRLQPVVASLLFASAATSAQRYLSPCAACLTTLHAAFFSASSVVALLMAGASGVFLSGLDSVYESAKNQMLTSPSIPPIDEAYSRLSRIPIPAATVPDTTSAMLAPRGRGGSFFARGRGGRGRGPPTSRPVCQFCHRIGHTVDKCWQKHGRPAFAHQTASTESPEQPKAQHTAPSSELRVDDLLSQLRSLIGDRPQHAPDPTTSTVTTAASASSSGMYSACTFCPANDTTD
ncbi:hypothetical protein EJ110_NYTH51328 [Nymphaea thermarum]|nr:hypothetical protein EJ110_NYTH51328 [Nymphaea thermarum]